LARIHGLLLEDPRRTNEEIEQLARERGFKDLLGHAILESAQALGLALDIGGLRVTRRDFMLEWERFGEKELVDWDWYGDPETRILEGIVNEPLNVIERYIEPLEAAYGTDETTRLQARLEILQSALRSLPRIVALQPHPPKSG
jgi:hypothetical protein